MASKGSCGSRSRPAKRLNTKNADTNEPAAKASRKTTTDLNIFPEHILLQVFSKLPSKSRVMMKKTCSNMSDFLERHRTSLANTFCMEGVCIDVHVKKGKVTFKPKGSKQSFPISDFQKMLSGLSIRKLFLNLLDNTPLQIIEDAFKTFGLVASVVVTGTRNLTLDWTPLQYLQFSNIAKAQDAFYINFRSFELAQYLPSFLKSRNAEQMTIIADDVVISRDIDQALVECMMNCRAFDFKLKDTHFFKQFLWALHSCRLCSLEYANFGFLEINGSLFNGFGFPPMKILWDLQSFDVHETPVPYSIRLITSENKWIVVAESLTLFIATRRIGTSVHIKFFEKGDDLNLLDFLLPSSLKRKFTPKRTSLYINSSPEDRFDMLRKFYFDQAKKDGLLQQETFLTYKEYLLKENLADRRNL